VAQATANPTSGHSPLAVSFIGAGTDSDGTIAGYAWDFGDGASSIQQSPSHVYSSQGTYTATLTVTDNQGATGSKSIQITVLAPNQPPNVTADAAPTKGSPPLAVSFTGSATDSDGTIASYHWDFGDGTGADQPNTSHTYSAEGTYTATLTATDDDGATASKSFTIRVNAAPNAPKGLKLGQVK
jgi:PKD repeat protein